MEEEMADRQKSHFGSDGYKELYVRQKAVNRDGKRINNKDLYDLRQVEYKNKKRSSRAGKFIIPQGTGKRNIGQFR